MKRLADQTLYEILEVPPGASADQIQAAYEKARAVYGPGSLVTYTLMEPDEAALLESRIEDARATLLDPERRARYDEALHEPQEARAAAGGAAPATTGIQAQGSAPARPAPEPVPQRPAILLGGALEAAGPAEDESPPPLGPILLLHELSPQGREVAPLAASDAPEESPALAGPTEAASPRPSPTATAGPTSTSTPTSTPTPTTSTPAPTAAPAPALPPPPLPDAWTGDALRQVRESRGLSIALIAERTKVTRHHIENIEADRFASLPAQVYLRGILLTLARELRLDGQKVARSYIERLPPGTGTAGAKSR